MEQKLSIGKSPVSRYFPNYHGGATDVSAASDFFDKKFRGLIRNESTTWVETHFVETTDNDAHIWHMLVASARKALISQLLTESNFL